MGYLDTLETPLIRRLRMSGFAISVPLPRFETRLLEGSVSAGQVVTMRSEIDHGIECRTN